MTVKNGSSTSTDITEDTIENYYNACFSYFSYKLAVALALQTSQRTPLKTIITLVSAIFPTIWQLLWAF
jgi:hypothetical protein